MDLATDGESVDDLILEVGAIFEPEFKNDWLLQGAWWFYAICAEPGLQLFQSVVDYAMGEFLGRWVLVGGVSVVVLSSIGMRAGGFLGWLLAGLWLGFCNAALRPVVLRMQWRAEQLLGVLFGTLALLNTLLVLSAKSWLPLAGSPDALPSGAAIVVLTLCSFGAAVRFRAHDGRWHWITYHGSVSKKG